MSLLRKVSLNFEIIASYDPFDPINTTTNFPSGRQWKVYYTGGQGFSNRITMKIVVTVVNYQCTDAGLYKCQVLSSQATTHDTYPVNLTAKSQINHTNIIMSPHKGNDPYSSTNVYGENITLTCRASGPSSLQILWNYTVVNRTGENIQASNVIPARDADASSSTCSTISFTSALVVQLQEPGNSITYYCIVSDNGVEQSRRNVTIHIVLSSTTTNISTTTLSTNNNAGTCNTMRPMKMICFLTCVSAVMRFSILSFNYW
uniref:Ig-like domain-containing protein n=1 Tax=Biomphalaria glabrata TaxID=6526 RepID=A0A2C9KN94_BIOGL